LADGTLTINKASLTATANNISKTYGAVNPSFPASYTGFLGTDNASVIDTPPTGNTTATQFSNVGTYPITLSGASDNNYNFTYGGGTLPVNKASLSATADNLSKTYGSVNPSLTLTYSGFVGLDNASVIDTPPSVSTAATQFSNTGSYNILVSGGTDNNYALTLNNGTLTINKAPLSASAHSTS